MKFWEKIQSVIEPRNERSAELLEEVVDPLPQPLTTSTVLGEVPDEESTNGTFPVVSISQDDDRVIEGALVGLRHEIDVVLPVQEEILDADPNPMPDLDSHLFKLPGGIFGKGVDYDPDNQPDRTGLYRGFVVGGLIVLIVAGILLYKFVIAPSVSVPDLVGKSSVEAIHTLNAQGLALGDMTEREVTGVEEGTVVNQDPRVDIRVVKGTKVSLVIAKAGDMTSVPSLTGMTEKEAQTALTDSRLSMVNVSTYSDTISKGHVVGQLPVSETAVAATTSVTVLISSGRYSDTIAVPRVLGLGADEAGSVLRSKGLNPTIYYASTSFGNANEVVVQTPSSQSAVSPRTVVQLLVSKPSSVAQTSVPDVVGLTSADAQKIIISAGLSVQTVYATDRDVPAGNVIAQMPISKNTILQKGDSVGLLMSVGPSSTVIVPDVLRESVSQAQQELTSIGLVPVVVAADSSNNGNNTVVQQFPAGRSSYRLGMSVLLYAPVNGAR
ncbi:MAG: PASTA domain-containing protein [Coriobacteriia bacterium]|nr:PASTA domain-containing protein [Coriobacteriia bacterium]